MRTVSRKRVLVSLFVGAIVEIIAFFAAAPEDSVGPLTPLERFLGPTQAPGELIFFLLAGAFGHSLDKLPKPLGSVGVWLMFASAFLIQAAVFAVPVWLIWHLAAKAPDKRVTTAETR